MIVLRVILIIQWITMVFANVKMGIKIMGLVVMNVLLKLREMAMEDVGAKQG